MGEISVVPAFQVVCYMYELVTSAEFVRAQNSVVLGSFGSCHVRHNRTPATTPIEYHRLFDKFHRCRPYRPAWCFVGWQGISAILLDSLGVTMPTCLDGGEEAVERSQGKVVAVRLYNKRLFIKYPFRLMLRKSTEDPAKTTPSFTRLAEILEKGLAELTTAVTDTLSKEKEGAKQALLAQVGTQVVEKQNAGTG